MMAHNASVRMPFGEAAGDVVRTSIRVRRCIRVVLVLWLALYGAHGGAYAKDEQVTKGDGKKVVLRGKVVDEHGKPVGGVQIGQGWRPLLWSFVPVLSDATTEADGSFSVELMLPEQKGALLAMDAARAHGALVLWDPRHFQRTYRVRLEPLVTVRMSVDLSALPADAEPTLNVFAVGCAVPILANTVSGKVLTFALPPGSYEMKITHDMCGDFVRAFTIGGDKEVVTLDPVLLEAGHLAKYMHKTLPAWHITDARGIAKDITLSDLRGKWVIVDFWLYGCMPCVKYSIPDLMRFYDKHAEQRDQFQVLLFHGPGVKDFKKLDPRIKKLTREVWKGRQPPFPIVLDATGQTVKEWKVEGYPTLFIIDPTGTLVYAKSGAGAGSTIESFFLEALRRPIDKDK